MSKRSHVTTYEGTDIYVDEEGHFYATPPGCRKERDSASMFTIKLEIRDVIDRRRQKKRKDANHGVYIFDEKNGAVDMNAMYIGVRGKETNFGDAGHVFQVSGMKKTISKNIRVVPGYTSQEDIFELEAAHERMRTALEAYSQQLRKSTRLVRPGYFSKYGVSADRLIKDQEKMLKLIREAQGATITEDSNA
jgi:hypothetical protein